MRKIFGILFCILILGEGLKAQPKYGEDSVNCVINLSLYREYYKQKNYDDAINPWRWVYNNCPSASGNIFKNGPTLIKYLMKKNPENKQAYIDTLMMIYDKRIQYFGKQGYVLGKKGADLIKYFPSSYEQAYSILGKSLEMQGNSSEAGALLAYFKAATLMEKNGKIDKQLILECYAKVAEITDYNLVNNTKKEKYYSQSSEIIESLFAPYANCDDLIGIYSSKFDTRKEDLDFLKRAIKNLKRQECINNELYFEVVKRLNKLEPTFETAMDLSNYYFLKKKWIKAFYILTKALAKYEEELDENQILQVKLNLANTSRLSGKYKEAIKLVDQILESHPNYGEAYLLKGNIYVSGASSCGNDFEQKTVYWVAIDKFIKAKSVDASVANKANKAIATYSKFFPNTEQCFFEGIESGQTFLVECWINEKTKVRTRD